MKFISFLREFFFGKEIQEVKQEVTKDKNLADRVTEVIKEVPKESEAKVYAKEIKESTTVDKGQVQKSKRKYKPRNKSVNKENTEKVAPVKNNEDKTTTDKPKRRKYNKRKKSE